MQTGEFGDLIRMIKRAAFKDMCKEHGIPHDIWLMVDCLVEAGCEIENVMDGMVKYSEKVQFQELIKDAGIKTEEDWK